MKSEWRYCPLDKRPYNHPDKELFLRGYIVAILFATFGISTLCAAPSSTDSTLTSPKPLLTVLCYHNIDLSRPSNSPYSVTSARFIDELNALKTAGFEFVSQEQVEAFYLSGKPLPLLSALITFDDGHQNIYERAYPILRRMKIPWVLFIYPTAIGVGHDKGFMDWADVRALRKDGVAIGSHSYDHPYLTRPEKEISTPETYETWLDKELVHSKRLIEEKLGATINSFAAPFGALNEASQRHIVTSGYSLAFNVFGSNNDALNNRLELNRIIVLASDTPETVVREASERPLHFVKESPGALQVVGGALATISFSLSSMENYIPGSIQATLNGTKVETLKENGSSFSFDLPTPDHTKGFIVTVHARDLSGVACSQSYYFIYASSKPTFLK